ncbi:met regulon transcriptional regulator MetJ [Rhodanobacter lindaniclasticus]
MATTKFIKPYVEHGEKANAVRKITVSIPLHVLRRLSDLRTHRQVNNLRHATNSDLLVEAFLHAFTGQPLPTDEELRRTMATAKKSAAKKPAAKKAAANETGCQETGRQESRSPEADCGKEAGRRRRLAATEGRPRKPAAAKKAAVTEGRGEEVIGKKPTMVR